MQDKCEFLTYSSDGTCRFWSFGKDNPPDCILKNIIYPDPNGLLNALESGASSPVDSKFIAEKFGIRACAIDDDHSLIACGDRKGNITLFDYKTLSKIAILEAHDSEITVLQFCLISTHTSIPKLVLVSGGRDRMIHIFDASKTSGSGSFDLLQTLDEHTSTITSLAFADKGSHLCSSSADKSVVFRKLMETEVFFGNFRMAPSNFPCTKQQQSGQQFTTW